MREYALKGGAGSQGTKTPQKAAVAFKSVLRHAPAIITDKISASTFSRCHRQ